MQSIQQLQQETTDCVKELQEYCSQLKSNAKELSTIQESEPETAALDTNQTALHQQGLQMFLGLKENHKKLAEKQEQIQHILQQFSKDFFRLEVQSKFLSNQISSQKRQISECKDFESNHKKLELMPLDQFRNLIQNREPSFLVKLAEAESQPTNTSLNHEIMMKRLELEISYRKELQLESVELEQKLKQLQEDNQNKTQFLQTIQTHVKNIATAAKPLQEQFTPSYRNLDKENDILKLLPIPLFVLYKNAYVYQEQFDKKMKLKIDGDEAKAKEFYLKRNSSEENEEDFSMTDVEEPQTKKQKMSLDYLLLPFPLHIIISLSVSFTDTTKEVELKFYYLPHSNTITVVDSYKILPRLFPLDNGLQAPSTLLENFKFTDFAYGKPFKWAQKLCGLQSLDFAIQPEEERKQILEQKSDTTPSKYDFLSIIELIKYKTKAYRILHMQISALETSQISEMVKKQILSQMDQQDDLGMDKHVKLKSFAKSAQNSKETQKRNFTALLQAQNKDGEIAVELEASIDIEWYQYPIKAPLFSLVLKKGRELFIDAVDYSEIPQEVMKTVFVDTNALEERNQELSSNSVRGNNSNSVLAQWESLVNDQVVRRYDIHNNNNSTTTTTTQQVQEWNDEFHFYLLSSQVYTLLLCLYYYLHQKHKYQNLLE